VVRSDARENRARILDAARAAFAEDDRTSMNQVAQRAGVGAGTLYRNFPTREALVLAVYQDEVDRIIGTVPDLLAAMPPREALRHWTMDLVEAMRRKHGLGDALSAEAHQTITERAYHPGHHRDHRNPRRGQVGRDLSPGRRPRRLPSTHRRPLARRPRT